MFSRIYSACVGYSQLIVRTWELTTEKQGRRYLQVNAVF
jgi:hypothetical protein